MDFRFSGPRRAPAPRTHLPSWVPVGRHRRDGGRPGAFTHSRASAAPSERRDSLRLAYACRGVSLGGGAFIVLITAALACGEPSGDPDAGTHGEDATPPGDAGETPGPDGGEEQVCTPGEALECDGDDLVVCNEEGSGQEVSPCTLGLPGRGCALSGHRALK